MFLAFFFGAFGAIVAELLKRWQQWNDLPARRFLALSRSKQLWTITALLVLLGGGVGIFAGTKTHPIDWSLSFLVGMGTISAVRNFLSGVAAQTGPRAKRRRLNRQRRRRRTPSDDLSGKSRSTKIEQKGATRDLPKVALGKLQEPVLEETERALQKAIRLYPQNAEAHYILGVLLKEGGRLEEAGRAFQEAIRLNLQNAETHYNLGVVLKERHRFEEAEQAFQEAIRLNPQDASASDSVVAGSPQGLSGLEKLGSLSEQAEATRRTPIGWRDILN